MRGPGSASRPSSLRRRHHMARRRKRNLPDLWSHLPIDVLDNIIKRLDLPVDGVSFSGVCKPWRHVALGSHMRLSCKLQMHHFAPQRRPLPMLLHPGCDDPNTHQLYSLSGKKLYGKFHLQDLSNKWIVGSGAGWLVTVDVTDPQVDLLNPLTGKKIPLPHLSTLPRCDKIYEEVEDEGNDPTTYWYFRKVVVGYYRGSFLVVAVVSKCRTIRFCRIGDSKWNRVDNSPLFIDDIMFHKGKLYAVNTWSVLFGIDIADTAKVTMVAQTPYGVLGEKGYLVDFCGELVLLARTIGKMRRKRNDPMTMSFDAFKLGKGESGYHLNYDTETGMRYQGKAGHLWAQLENLGHHMLFIGYNHSLSLDSRVYPGCEGNCVYFADCRQDEYDVQRMRGRSKKYYHDVGVYHMHGQKVEYLKKFCSASSPMNMVWLSPTLFHELEMQMVPQ